jgi:hypothetical protein
MTSAEQPGNRGQGGSGDSPGHPGDLTLRRLRAGEFASAEAEAIEQHTARCGRCRARLAAIDDEQRAFERAIPFERFAGGVERAARVPTPKRATPAWLRALWAMPALGLVGAAALVLLAHPAGRDLAGPAGLNRSKGAAVDAVLRIAGPDGRSQRALLPDGNLRLGPGDRLRVGYETDRARHLVLLSLDDQNVMTALFPDTGTALSGASVRVEPTASATYLPGSIQLDGAGNERLYLFLADGPFPVDAAVAAVRAARTAAGPKGLPGMTAPAAAQALDALNPRSFTWLLAKP